MSWRHKSRWIPLAAWLARALLRGLARGVRQRTLSEAELARLRDPRPAILVMWHDETVLAATHLPLLIGARRLAVLASQSNDGELVARIAKPMNLQVVRGSASRGGREGLRALYRAIAKHHASPLLMPDGPRGPRHEVKPGAAVLAQMTGAPILPLHFAANSIWHLRSWDRMAVPKPAARVALHVGDFLAVPRALDEGDLERTCAEIASRLKSLRHAASNSVS